MIAEKDRASKTPHETPSPGRPVVASAPASVDRFRPRAQEWGAADPMAKRRAKGLPRAREWSRRRPETFAVLVGSFAVSLLCLYVAAYARVTAESFERARLAVQLEDAQAEERALQAEVSRLRMPQTVRARAGSLGLIQGDARALNLVTPTASRPAVIPSENHAPGDVKETP